MGYRDDEDYVANEAYEMSRNAQENGISKKRMAEILDDAWDAARKEQLNVDMNLTIRAR